MTIILVTFPAVPQIKLEELNKDENLNQLIEKRAQGFYLELVFS